MNEEEELFCKLFPEYVVNGKPLSPYFDLFESGYEQSEKRIAELEKKNAELKTDYKVLSCSVGDFDELQGKYEEEQRKNNQLSDNRTKAKEIISNLLEIIIRPYQFTAPRKIQMVNEAEQFLKNSEVEKMNCPKCNKRMKKQLWGFADYYVCEYCGYIVLTSEEEK